MPRSEARWTFVAAALALSLACNPPGARAPAPTPEAVSTAPAEAVFEVQVAPIQRGTIAQRISAPGTLEAHRESRIGAEVQGRIDSVFVDEGDRVEAGEALFQIDPEPYQMALRQAQAALEHARAERRQMEADLSRARELAKQNIGAPQQREKLETAVAVARSSERQAVELLALAQHKLDRTLVRAPYAASVAARLADEGTTALVQPQTIVVVLQEVDELEARATIPESRLASVRAGDPARIHVQGLLAPIETTIEAVGDAVDPATRTYTVRMRVPNADHALKAGLFAEIEILPRSKSDVLVVPRSAIRSEGGRSRVFVVRDGVATALDVTLGVIGEDHVEILSGPPPGTPVVVGEAAENLASGMRVRVVKAEGTGGA